MRLKHSAVLLLAFAMILSGCGAASSTPSSSNGVGASESSAGYGSAADWKPGYLPQFETPESGTPIVTLNTSMGDIKMMLFPQAAPKTVENFVQHCKDGYYDGVTFHRVIEDFMIQGGDPLGTGTGGESIWGNDFEDEFSDHLYNFRGAVSMANAGYGTNGSQFFIVQEDAAQYPNSSYRVTSEKMDSVMMYILQNAEFYKGTMQLNAKQAEPGITNEALTAYVDELNKNFQAILSQGVTDEVRARFSAGVQKYSEIGGLPNLDYKHTVFGQVLAGMDVVDAIARVETSAGDKPVTDVVIKSVTVETAQ